MQETYTFSTVQAVPKLTQISRASIGTTAAATRDFTYDSNGYLATAEDWNGNTTEYTNNTKGLPTSVVEADGTAIARTTGFTYHSTLHVPTQIVTSGLTIDFTYDTPGNMLTRTFTDTTSGSVPYSTNGQTRVWTYTWSNYLLATITGPRTDVTATTTFAYDSAGALTDITNPLSQVTQITSSSGGGLPLTVVDPNSVTTTLAYDTRLRLNTSTLATAGGNRVTTYDYDDAGNLTVLTMPSNGGAGNNFMSYTYDNAHRMTTVTMAHPFSQTSNYTLNAFGKPTAIALKDSGGTTRKSTSATYDALGRVLTRTGGAGQVTTYAYDSNGNATSIQDGLSQTTSHTYDALNRLTQITDRASGVTTMTYDAHDRPLTITAPNGAVTTNIYDGFGDAIKITSPDSGATVFYYDKAGNLTQKIDALSITANYTYDQLDRRLTASYPANTSENVTYTYDQSGHGKGIGRLTSMSDPAGTHSISYDERGNRTTETRTHGAVNLTKSYAYDQAGRMRQITYPSGAIVTYNLNALGRVSSVAFKQNSGATSQNIATSVTYRPFGPYSSFTFGNGATHTRTFDQDYRITKVKDTGTANIHELTYTFDNNDNATAIVDAVTSANNQTLGYDDLDRMTSASGGYGSLSYGYDANGNRTSAGGTSYTYTTNTNRLTAIGSQAITTNSNGSITQFAAVTPNPAVNLTYYNNGRLATVSNGGTQVLSYLYDGFGKRLAKQGAALHYYEYAPTGELLEVTDNTGAAIVDYIHLYGRPIATYEPASGNLAFLHTDRIGTVQRATDSTQTLKWSGDYEPFGYTPTSIGLIVQDLRLPGQEYEIETGHHYNGFRDYLPALGRYLESDPIGLAGGINTYAYVENNPAKYIDREG